MVKVVKFKQRGTILFSTQGSLDVNLFLSYQAEAHAGQENILDLLNSKRAFIHNRRQVEEMGESMENAPQNTRPVAAPQPVGHVDLEQDDAANEHGSKPHLTVSKNKKLFFKKHLLQTL